jgi:hypothetical protein
MFSMGLYQEPQLLQLQCCSCCGQDMDKDKNKESVLIEFLNSCQGKEMRYRLCPTCFQSVDESLWTRGYKSKWTRRVKKFMERRTDEFKAPAP